MTAPLRIVCLFEASPDRGAIPGMSDRQLGKFLRSVIASVLVTIVASLGPVPSAVAHTRTTTQHPSFPRSSHGMALAVAAAPVVTATLVQEIRTSQFSPASPDPSGVVYLPGPDRLEISDSEVEETTGAGYHGVNLWQVTRNGTVTDTGTTHPAFSKEPTGLGYDPNTNTLFISDDNKRYVHIDKPGQDGRFGTSDDVVTHIDAGAYGSTDTEDPEFDTTTGNPSSGHLFFLDGAGTEVYEINPVDGIFGNPNDTMTHFNVGTLASDFEGLSSDPVRNTLLVGGRATKQIYELTKSGTLVRTIDVSGISGLRFISGLALAPASDGSGRMDYWIVDRQVDNGHDSSENDGMLFEVRVPGSDAPPTVTLTDPAQGSTVSGASVPVTASASDDIGVTQVRFFDGATLIGTDNNGADGWSTTWNTIAVADGSHTITATATDTTGQNTSDSHTVMVDNVDDPPSVTITTPADGSFVNSTTVPIQANASDDTGVTQVEFFADGTSLGVDSDGSNGWASPVSASFGDGPHTVTAIATDTASQTASDTNGLTIDTAGPTVSISQPSAGDTVSGAAVSVAATASDANAVTSVQFFADATSIGTDSSGGDGWSVVWNTTTGNNGTRTLTAVATDAATNATTSAGIVVTVDNPLIADIPIASSSDDAEERVSRGRMTLTSGDLDMMLDGTTLQSAVGLRFTGLNIPRGATVLDAYVQFQANRSGSDSTTLTISGQAIDNAPTFTTTKFNITSRTRTAASVSWTPATWVQNAHGPDERTPQLATVLQEIVIRPGWSTGNALVLIITGSGKRIAESFDRLRFAAVLHVEWADP